MAAGTLAAWVFFLLVLVAGANRAEAQIQPPPPAAVLTDIAVSDTGQGASQIALTFSPLAPKYSIIADGTDTPSIAFALSSRGLGAKFPTALHGLLRAIAIEQNDTILIFHLTAASAVHLAATPVGDKLITLKISKAVASVPPTSAVATSGPLPAQDEPAPGQDGFEVVPLKYADVSEVVGLLTDGQTVKSNDLFTPHEPAFGSAGMGGQATFTPTMPSSSESPDDPLAQSVTGAIGVDRRLNAIILKGSPDLIARLKERIAQIDIPVESVILETVFVELTDTGAKNIGLDFNNANSQIGVATFDTGAFIPSGFRDEPWSVECGPAGCDLRPGSIGTRTDRVEAAHRRTERHDRQNHHRRCHSDPDRDYTVRGQRSFATGTVRQCRCDAANCPARQFGRFCDLAYLLRGLQRHGVFAGLSDNQPEGSANLRHGA